MSAVSHFQFSSVHHHHQFVSEIQDTQDSSDV